MSAADGEGFAIDPTAVRAWKRYPAYKDSGVAWLGEVPAGWEVKKIRHCSTVKRGASPRPIDDLKYFDDFGEYGWEVIPILSRS